MGKTEIKKIYYSIREVAEKTGVEPHVLRFWEKEFPMLRPRRGRSKNRSYRERDIWIVLAIKALLYGQKYTIKGAVERLKNDRSLWEDGPPSEPESTPVQTDPGALLSELKTMLAELKNLINGNA